MVKPAFLLTSFLRRNDDGPDQCFGRGIAFPVATTKQGRTVFCTCSHSVTEQIARGAELLLVYEDGTIVPRGRPIRNIVPPPASNLDLSFFEADINREVPLVRFGNREIRQGMELSHVQNVFAKPDFPDENAHIRTQVAGARMGSFAQLPNGTFERIDAGLRQSSIPLPKSPHRGILIQSWPGVSGSPLWDTHGNVLGMVAAGNEEPSERYPEFFLVFLPSKQIQKGLKMVLAEMNK